MSGGIQEMEYNLDWMPTQHKKQAMVKVESKEIVYTARKLARTFPHSLGCEYIRTVTCIRNVFK